MATEKKEAGGGEKTKPADESKAKIVTEPDSKDAVAKKPEEQKEILPTGDTSVSEHPFVKKASEDAKEVHLNHVGQKIENPISEADSYMTPDGKHMIVQMEDDNTIFAGEYGKNAQHYPKSIVDTWAKHEPLKVKEEKSDKKKKDEAA